MAKLSNKSMSYEEFVWNFFNFLREYNIAGQFVVLYYLSNSRNMYVTMRRVYDIINRKLKYEKLINYNTGYVILIGYLNNITLNNTKDWRLIKWKARFYEVIPIPKTKRGKNVSKTPEDVQIDILFDFLKKEKAFTAFAANVFKQFKEKNGFDMSSLRAIIKFEHNYRSLRMFPYTILDFCMDWGKTPQGWKYWERIFQKVNQLRYTT